MNLISRMITGIVLIFGSVLIFFSFLFGIRLGMFGLFYSIPLLIVGIFILFNKDEDKIEEINYKGGKQ